MNVNRKWISRTYILVTFPTTVITNLDGLREGVFLLAHSSGLQSIILRMACWKEHETADLIVSVVRKEREANAR